MEGGKDGGVEPTIVQSLLKLVSKKYLFDIFVITSSQSIAIVVDTLKYSAGTDRILDHSLKNWISSSELIIR